MRHELGLEKPRGGRSGACRGCFQARAGSVQASGRQEVGLKSFTGESSGPTKAGRSWAGAAPKEAVAFEVGVGSVEAAAGRRKSWA